MGKMTNLIINPDSKMWRHEKQKKKPGESFPIRVTTMDAELEFCLERNMTGNDLLHLVCRMIALRETWYFGLRFMTVKGEHKWLDLSKKVLKQRVKKSENGYHFYFLVKFFPEDVSEELIQDITQHLFFLQIKQSILNNDIYCPPEASVLLASYAVQAKFGDFDESTYKEGFLMREEEVLPQRVVDQYQMTPEMWEDRIKHWWMNNKGLSREEAEMEYLRIAQDLDTYGVQYFLVYNKKYSKCWIGITALGINCYEENNKMTPISTFSWAEIKNIAFKNNKFSIYLNERKFSAGEEILTFYSQGETTNALINEFCIGNYKLFLTRRSDDPLEVQQMKIQAREDRLRKQTERHKLEKERTLRIQLEREKERLQMEIVQLKEQLLASQETLQKCEETAQLLAQKADLSAEEAVALGKRASEVEADNQRLRIAALKTEQDKVVMEFKARDAELIAARMIEESERRTNEAARLKEDLTKARQAEKLARQKLYELTANYYSPYPPSNNLDASSTNNSSSGSYGYFYGGFIPTVGGHHQNFRSSMSAAGGSTLQYDSISNFGERDLRSLSDEIEKERMEYDQKSKHMQEQLSELKQEIDGLKLEERQTQFDKMYQDALQHGEDKYSTLKRTGAGSAKARVALFDGL